MNNYKNDDCYIDTLNNNNTTVMNYKLQHKSGKMKFIKKKLKKHIADMIL